MTPAGAVALVLLLFAGGLAAQTGPESVEAKRKDLEAMERELETLEADLEARRSSRAVLAAELERRERDMAQLARAGHDLKAMIEEQGRVVTGLQRELATEQGRLEAERSSIAELLRSIHAFGGREHLRMLLDLEDVARIGRVLSYYGYLNRYRLRRLRSFAERARRLESLRLEASGETQRLALLAARQEETRSRLAVAQAERAGLLSDLERTILSRQERFAALREDAEGLRALVEQLELQAAILPEAEVAQEPIGTLRGQLEWPLEAGGLLERFGDAKGDSGQRWDGVLLAAPEGSPVRAVHHGRIAYADWLRGFGLLIIIEHDDGVLTLYGHNQTLLKEPGEWVDSGETIALSGSSGGQRRPGLYFAIRRQGRPLDPERWCGSRKTLGRLAPLKPVSCRARERRGRSSIEYWARDRAARMPAAARRHFA